VKLVPNFFKLDVDLVFYDATTAWFETDDEDGASHDWRGVKFEPPERFQAKWSDVYLIATRQISLRLAARESAIKSRKRGHSKEGSLGFAVARKRLGIAVCFQHVMRARLDACI
jgi:hypothetical protein